MPYARYIEVVIHPRNDNHALGNDRQKLTCPVRGCGNPLELHQPDLAVPDRLLGTCLGCGQWSLVLLKRETGGADLVELPIKEMMSEIEPVDKLA